MSAFDVVQTVLAAANSDVAVGSGKISGGWEYVWASYGITWGALILYSVSLWLRRPEAKSPNGERT